MAAPLNPSGVESDQTWLKSFKPCMLASRNHKWPKGRGLQWDNFVLRGISLFGRAANAPFSGQAILLFSKTEEVVHRGWDTGRKRIFCLEHKHKISKQMYEPKLKGNELSDWEKCCYCCLFWFATTLPR